MQTPNAMRNAIQSPYTSKRALHLHTSSTSLKPVKNLIVSMENKKKVKIFVSFYLFLSYIYLVLACIYHCQDNVMQTSNATRDEFQSPHTSKKALQLQSSHSLKPVENLLVYMENKKKVYFLSG